MRALAEGGGDIDVTPDGWQYVPAVILLTVLVAAYRALRGRPIDEPVAGSRTVDAEAAVPEQPTEQR